MNKARCWSHSLSFIGSQSRLTRKNTRTVGVSWWRWQCSSRCYASSLFSLLFAKWVTVQQCLWMEFQSGRTQLFMLEIPSVSTFLFFRSFLFFSFWREEILCINSLFSFRFQELKIELTFPCSLRLLSVFRHKHQYDLYIFQNQRAFTLCDFTQATLLTKPGSNTFTVCSLSLSLFMCAQLGSLPFCFFSFP